MERDRDEREGFFEEAKTRRSVAERMMTVAMKGEILDKVEF